MANLPIGALNGTQIKQLDIITNASADNFRAASYDFQIGQIITPDGDLTTQYKLPPQGIVEVISKEALQMPINILGNVQIKTSFSNLGLLALGIGIADPGYHGKVSSFIVNFSKDERMLLRGESFLRVIFMKINNTDLAVVKETPNPNYINEARNRVVSGFSSTFLNTDKVVEKFLDEATDKYKKQFFTYVSIAAFGLAIMTFMLNFGTFSAMQRWLDPRVVATGEAEADFKASAAKFQKLIDRIDELEKKMPAEQNEPVGG